LQPLVLHTFLVTGRYDGSAIAAAGNQKPEAAITVFDLLMMGGVSPETC
jgi:inosine-uridine nucleoside N-ribohydrolase